MKRTRKNQILAGLALFAIFFSVISTAILVLVTPPASAPTGDEENMDINELLKQYSGSVEVLTGSSLSGNTLTGTTK